MGKVFIDVLRGSSPYDTGAGPHTSYELIQSAKKANRHARGVQPSCGYKRSPVFAKTSGRKGGPPLNRHPTAPQLCTLSALPHLTWRPRPTCHVTGAPVTTCKKLHRHSCQCCASSTAEPVPRLKASLCMTQQCQFRATIMGQSAAGIGAAVGMAQKWAGSNGSSRRAGAAVKSPAGSRPLLK
jgi:hypothetical protein